MNIHDHTPDADNAQRSGVADAADTDEALAFRLRGLRRDVPPANDLWPGIAARIAKSTPDAPRDSGRIAASARSRRAAPRFAPWALAASLVLAVGVAWQQRPATAPDASNDPAAQLLPRAADAMTREYDAALSELQASARHDGTPAAPSDPALRELDRGAAQIRTALARDPQSRFLLDRLRTTYEKRLQLTQRAALS